VKSLLLPLNARADGRAGARGRASPTAEGVMTRLLRRVCGVSAAPVPLTEQHPHQPSAAAVLSRRVSEINSAIYCGCESTRTQPERGVRDNPGCPQLAASLQAHPKPHGANPAWVSRGRAALGTIVQNTDAANGCVAGMRARARLGTTPHHRCCPAAPTTNPCRSVL
jgi:hypothetical protein